MLDRELSEALPGRWLLTPLEHDQPESKETLVFDKDGRCCSLDERTRRRKRGQWSLRGADLELRWQSIEEHPKTRGAMAFVEGALARMAVGFSEVHRLRAQSRDFVFVVTGAPRRVTHRLVRLGGATGDSATDQRHLHPPRPPSRPLPLLHEPVDAAAATAAATAIRAATGGSMSVAPMDASAVHDASTVFLAISKSSAGSASLRRLWNERESALHRLIPVWLGEGNPTGAWATVACLHANRSDHPGFREQLLRAVNMPATWAGDPGAWLPEEELVPYIELGDRPDTLPVREAWWQGLVRLLLGLPFLLWAHSAFVEGSLVWMVLSWTYGASFTVAGLRALLLPRLELVLTHRFLFLRDDFEFHLERDRSLPRGWRSIPLDTISHFEPGRIGIRAVLRRKLDGERDPSIEIRLSTLGVAEPMARILNGFLATHRPPLLHFVRTGSGRQEDLLRLGARAAGRLAKLAAVRGIQVFTDLRAGLRPIAMQVAWRVLALVGLIYGLVTSKSKDGYDEPSTWFGLLVYPWVFVHDLPTTLRAVFADDGGLQAVARRGFQPLVTPRLLVSYSTEDRGFVLDLVAELRRLGASVWLDVFDLEIGGEVDESIRNGLEHAPCLVVVLSLRSIESQYVARELETARSVWGAALSVVPVFIEDVDIPEGLRDHRYVDLRRRAHGPLRSRVDTRRAEALLHLWSEAERATRRADAIARRDGATSGLVDAEPLRGSEPPDHLLDPTGPGFADGLFTSQRWRLAQLGALILGGTLFSTLYAHTGPVIIPADDFYPAVEILWSPLGVTSIVLGLLVMAGVLQWIRRQVFPRPWCWLGNTHLRFVRAGMVLALGSVSRFDAVGSRVLRIRSFDESLDVDEVRIPRGCGSARDVAATLNGYLLSIRKGPRSSSMTTTHAGLRPFSWRRNATLLSSALSGTRSHREWEKLIEKMIARRILLYTGDREDEPGTWTMFRLLARAALSTFFVIARTSVRSRRHRGLRRIAPASAAVLLGFTATNGWWALDLGAFWLARIAVLWLLLALIRGAVVHRETIGGSLLLLALISVAWSYVSDQCYRIADPITENRRLVLRQELRRGAPFGPGLVDKRVEYDGGTVLIELETKESDGSRTLVFQEGTGVQHVIRDLGRPEGVRFRWSDREWRFYYLRYGLELHFDDMWLDSAIIHLRGSSFRDDDRLEWGAPRGEFPTWDSAVAWTIDGVIIDRSSSWRGRAVPPELQERFSTEHVVPVHPAAASFHELMGWISGVWHDDGVMRWKRASVPTTVFVLSGCNARIGGLLAADCGRVELSDGDDAGRQAVLVHLAPEPWWYRTFFDG